MPISVAPTSSSTPSSVASTSSLPKEAPESPPSASTVADTSSRIRAADSGSMTGVRGSRAPDLLSDWTASAVRCAAEDQALSQCMPRVQAEVDRKLAKAARPLDEDAQAELYEEVAARLSEPLIPGIIATIEQSPASVNAAVHSVIASQRRRVAGLRDPFTPIALNDPAARSRETVLWENPRVMVIVDAFAGAPKALVIPKQRMTYPTDAPAGLLAELSTVAFAVGEALSRAASTLPQLAAVKGARPAKIWINPPPSIGVSQLHVHVLPELPAWRRVMPKQWKAAERSVEAGLPQDGSAPGRATGQTVSQEFQRRIAPETSRFYAAVSAELARRPELVALP